MPVNAEAPAPKRASKFKPTSLDAADRKHVTRALREITEAATELATAKPESETPEADLLRIAAVHKKIFDASQVLRAEAAYLRGRSVRNAIDSRMPRNTIGDLLGGINRWRVRQISEQVEAPLYEGTKITDRDHLAAKRAETDARKVAATNGTSAAKRKSAA